MDALSALIGLPDRLGAEHTAAEIAQQPATWPGTLALCREQQAELRRGRAGRDAGAAGGGRDLGLYRQIGGAAFAAEVVHSGASSGEH